MTLALVYTMLIGLIALGCLLASYLAYVSFGRLGYGPIGRYLVVGLFISALSWVGFNIGSQIIVPETEQIRAIVIMTSLATKLVGVSFLCLGFHKLNSAVGGWTNNALLFDTQKEMTKEIKSGPDNR